MVTIETSRGAPRHRRHGAAGVVLWLAAALALSACGGGGGSTSLNGMTPALHTAFPIQSGAHALDCATCHTNPASFAQFGCTGCHTHDQVPTDMVHNSVGTYAYASTACYQCHGSPSPGTFSHAGITGSCATCHAIGASFAALPQTGFAHMAIGTADCGGCHTTRSWSTGSMPSSLVHDPTQGITVAARVPTFSGTSILKVTAVSEQFWMSMDHGTAALPSTVLGNCAGCHSDAAAGNYYPGVLHSSLANQNLAEPTSCRDCHSDAVPTGFVGPTAAHPPRSPASGEMKHDAVAWSSNAPTGTRLVTADCGACHASPSATMAASWATGASGSGAPTFHASLTRAGLPQPSSCLDCHANTRPGVVTSATAAVPAGMSFDHGSGTALGDCASCHSASAAGGFTSWAGGRFHLAGSASPTSCLPCHSGERPTGTAGWKSATYTSSPFDYGSNAAGITHGDGQDCARCHTGPGTGAWGGTQNWVGGHFPHGASTVATSTCIACHMSQRPDLQPGATAASMATLLGFDHSVNGTGDCFGCHQATVTAGRYVDYTSPTTHALPGGDWKGAAAYPGDNFASAGDQFIKVTEITLVRTGTLVTGTSSTTATLFNGILHTSSAVPAAVSPGPAGAPNYGSCWHCHTSSNGTVTSFANGQFHAALTGYSATPGGAVTPLPQPTARCSDCHAQMRPAGIVEKTGSDVQPMDHAAMFTARATINGTSAAGVADLDCSTCHHSPGNTWADGVFHASIGSATPQDCTVCHYPLMADSARADVASGALFNMMHRSSQITQQKCDVCHTTALARSTGTPPATSAWNPGVYHASLAAQPTACLDCHSGSDPTAPTQSTVAYALAAGGTSSNGAQWMNHGASEVVGADCARCHAADARSSGAAWSRSTPYHASVATPGSCKSCHGLANGNGATMGTGNNLPSGLTSSSMVTSAAGDASTGVPAGTHDQITHADVNVSGFDCNFCHGQIGPSKVAGIQGKEWAQASFHTSFSSATPLTMNGSTGRCSNCHMNVKPGPTFTAMDHSSFTSAASSQDCSSCHSWPGTGTASAANWLGASGAPQYIFVGGFAIPQPPATTATTQTGITNLPHPGTATLACSACHTGGVGAKRAIGYDHASTLINTNCNSCHEAGTNLIGTVWNGTTTQSAGAGDSRPITLTNLTATRGGDSCRLTVQNHFYPVDCSQCHKVPTGTGAVKTGTAYTSAWTFPHSTSAMTNPSTCQLCHSQPGCGT